MAPVRASARSAVSVALGIRSVTVPPGSDRAAAWTSDPAARVFLFQLGLLEQSSVMAWSPLSSVCASCDARPAAWCCIHQAPPSCPVPSTNRPERVRRQFQRPVLLQSKLQGKCFSSSDCPPHPQALTALLADGSFSQAGSRINKKEAPG